MYLAHGSGEVLFSVLSQWSGRAISPRLASQCCLCQRDAEVWKGDAAALVLFYSSFCCIIDGVLLWALTACVFFFFSQPALMWRILSCLLAHSRIHTHTPDRRRTLVPWMIWEAWFLCQSLDSRPSCALQSGIYNQTPVNLIYFNKSMLVLLQTHQIMCTQTYIQDVHIFPIIRGYFLSRSLYLLVMNSYAFLHVVNNQIKF